MEYHSVDSFTPEGVEKILVPLLKEIEVLEFKLEHIESQINTIKKEHFKDLFVYENKKKYNSTLIPNKDILVQIKTLERTPAYLEYKKEVEEYKSSILNINTQIEKAKNKTLNNFSFDELNYKKYMDLFEQYLSTNDTAQFDLMMLEIFNNEFNNKSIYYAIKWTRHYEILYFLISKSPKDQQQFFRYVVTMAKAIDDEFDAQFFVDSPEYELRDLLTEYNVQYMIAKGEL